MTYKSTRITDGTFSIGQAAKLVHFPGGTKKFYEWLRSKKFILKDNFPSQQMVNRKWFKMRKPIIDSENTIVIKAIPRVTSRGIVGLDQIVSREFPICQPCKEQQSDEK